MQRNKLLTRVLVGLVSACTLSSLVQADTYRMRIGRSPGEQASSEATMSGGPNGTRSTVQVQPGDTAADVAQRLAAQLIADGVPAGDIRVEGNNVIIDNVSGASLVTHTPQNQPSPFGFGSIKKVPPANPLPPLLQGHSGVAQVKLAGAQNTPINSFGTFGASLTIGDETFGFEVPVFPDSTLKSLRDDLASQIDALLGPDYFVVSIDREQSIFIEGPDLVEVGAGTLFVDNPAIDSDLEVAMVWPCLLADINFDGRVDADDFFMYLDLFSARDLLADLTGSSDPTDDTYLVPDGDVDVDDFFVFLDLFARDCD